MARARARKIEPSSDTATAETTHEPDVFDEQIAARQQDQEQAALQQAATATATPPEHAHPTSHKPHHNSHSHQHTPARNGHAAAIEPRKFTPLPNPFGVESTTAGKNRVQLLKSESEEQRRHGQGAWVIRFAHNPNQDPGPNGETYSKENPHPVLKMLKEEGYRWGFDNADGKGGWGKPFSGDAYGADHIDARKVLQNAADMIGHKVDQGRIPD
jgi:hypothetical protein